MNDKFWKEWENLNKRFSFVTENRKTLNNPTVKTTLHKINSKRNLHDIEIKDCKNFIGDMLA